MKKSGDVQGLDEADRGSQWRLRYWLLPPAILRRLSESQPVEGNVSSALNAAKYPPADSGTAHYVCANLSTGDGCSRRQVMLPVTPSWAPFGYDGHPLAAFALPSN